MTYILLNIYTPPVLARIVDNDQIRGNSGSIKYEWVDERGEKCSGSSGGKCQEFGTHLDHLIVGVYYNEEGYAKARRTWEACRHEIPRIIQLLDGRLAKHEEENKAKQRERILREQANKEAERAVALERKACEENELKRKREEQAELERIMAAERERLRRLQYHFEDLDRKFDEDFLGARAYWHEHLSSFVNTSDFEERRNGFVRRWFARHPDLGLDAEQVEAVAEHGSHIQVTARAGSGKTRTLVARALFQIKHCRIPSLSTLILAFNKKAVEEIRERLLVHLSEEETPHVLTFHSLAYRIVRPDEKLIFDAGDSKEGQVFSSTIQRIIDSELRSGTLEQEIRSLMEDRWTMDLNDFWGTNLKKIVGGGYDLTKDEFLDFRLNLPSLTMDGRKVDSEVDKHIGNSLLRHRFRYSYGKTIHRYAGASYAPDFSHFDKNDERLVIIEVLRPEKSPPNPAREAFWKSDRAERALLLQMPSEIAAEETNVSEYVAQGLRSLGLEMSPMSDDELWEVLKDRVIDQFTKAVKQFIARCQKELISPVGLDVWIGRQSGKSHPVQRKFWRLGRKIFNTYLTVLSEEGKTDFDQLMLNAAEMIQAGHVRFTSSRGEGRLDRVKQVLIDEFQDFSHLFNELRKAFISQSPDALFFCVGDDWQAINKFAGSDLGYFTNFGDTFNPFVQRIISRNYRSCRKIVEAGNLVMAGEGPPSLAHQDEPGKVHIIHVEDAKDFSEIEEMVAEELGDTAVPVLRLAAEFTSQGLEVAILSRNGSKDSSEGVLRLEAWEKKLREFLPESQKELLKVSTAHGYKGRESDVVIMLRPEYYPSIHPDAVFNTIFGDTLESNVADEKRLFYVGVTRARTKLFLLHDKPPENPFRQVPSTFLRLVTNKTSYDINRITARLVCGERVIVRLSNQPGLALDSGTYPLKDQLKREKFKWSDEGKTWSRFLDPGSISSPLECSQFLRQQSWINQADGVVASFAWGDQQHRIQIDRSAFVPERVPSTTEPVQTRATAQGTLSHDTANAPSHPTKHFPQLQPEISPTLQPGISNATTPAPPSHPQRIEIHHTQVAGVTYGNRAPVIRSLRAGETVILRRQPQNSKDPNAIQVLTTDSRSLGYVPAVLSARLARRLDGLGGQLPATVTAMDPGEINGSYLSLSIEFEIAALPPMAAIAAAPMQVAHSLSIAPPKSSPSLLDDLPPSLQSQLTDLSEERLREVIADLYLSGACGWPTFGYEAIGPDGRCTGSMLEIAWPDNKIGIATPVNDDTSFIASGWKILPAATVSVVALTSFFDAATGQSITEPPIESPADNPEAAEMDHRHKHGPFMDVEPDEDFPF